MNGTSKALPFLIQRASCLPSYKSNHLVFADALKSCASMSDIQSGKSLHSHAVKLGHDSCQFVLKALLNMYAKCRVLGDCQKLFDETTERDTVTWNILLSCFSGSRTHSHKVIGIFNALHAAGYPKPSSVTLAVVLPVCTLSGTRVAGKCIHSYAVKCGMETQVLVGNALLSMYAKCGLAFNAFAIFCEIADKDVVSYNALIAGLAENNLVEDAFSVFCEMTKGSVMPNYATIVNVLPLCAAVECDLGCKAGKALHCYILRRAELETEISVVNALLSFYLRSGQTREAEYVFSGMKHKDLVSWNSVIAGYASNGQWHEALAYFREFLHLQIFALDSVTIISILPVCAKLSYPSTGKEIHAYVLRRHFLHDNLAVRNALINFYSKCCCSAAALNAFLSAPELDVISWNTMLDAFAETSLESQFADLFCSMLENGVKPDGVTLLTAVRFWASLSPVKNIREAHGFSLRSGIFLSESEPNLANAFLDAYAKLGNVEYASKIFQKLREVIRNTIFSVYSTTLHLMLRAYAQNEHSLEALSLFQSLQRKGVKPDATAITIILPVCGQMASVNLLRQCHGYAIRACFEDVHLNAALLDVYSKCGSISRAYKVYYSSSVKDLVVFTAMIGGLAMHGLGKEAISIFGSMLQLGVKPDHVVITAVLSACRHSGLIDEGLAIFRSIDQVHHMEPSVEQYACIVDLLARRGRIQEAFSFLDQMPIAADASLWSTLLGACRTHHDLDIGHVVADHLLNIQTSDIGNYVVLSNLYAADSRWGEVLEVRRLMKMKEMKKPAGCSWIEFGRNQHMFVAGDCAHSERGLIYDALSHLDKQTRDICWFPLI